jgi:DNA polymerase
MTERIVTLADEADLEGFRRAARECLARGLEPAQVQWRVATRAEGDLFGAIEGSTEAANEANEANAPGGTGREPPAAMRVDVPAHFIALCERIVLHSDEGRFGLLYRLLSRLSRDRALLQDPLDPDVLQAESMARAVRRDMHKMTAFVRFRPLAAEDGSVQHVAWFEPDHHIVEATAPFFARRFAQMHWAILTPERCVRWDGHALMFGPGANRDEAPPADAAERFGSPTTRASSIRPGSSSR